MNAGAIPAVAAVLKSVTKEKAQQIAAIALQQISSAEAKERHVRLCRFWTSWASKP